MGSGLGTLDTEARRPADSREEDLVASRVGVEAVLFAEVEVELVLSTAAGEVDRGLLFEALAVFSRDVLAFRVAKTGEVDRLAAGGSFFRNGIGIPRGFAGAGAVPAEAIARASVLVPVDFGAEDDSVAAAAVLSFTSFSLSTEEALDAAAAARLLVSASAISLSPCSSTAFPFPFRLLKAAASSLDLFEVTLMASSVLF